MKVIIIGSGMSGLTAGAYLARAGHAVTIFEQFPSPGGVTATVRQDGFGWDIGPLLLEGFAPGDKGRRILHVGDGTWRAIMDGLVEALKSRPNVELMTNVTAVDLITYPHNSRDPLAAYQPITFHGAYVFDRAGKTVHRTLAAATILATGGL